LELNKTVGQCTPASGCSAFKD